ncbi:hypothetical protein [Prochlorococcus marinus]|uniref:hypothetical protein n=1 Tax=Prochlorococcus TaxID=1218 RepID=UPI0007B31CD6|nr:hypothetical protein [Prochlorococcus marinus]
MVLPTVPSANSNPYFDIDNDGTRDIKLTFLSTTDGQGGFTTASGWNKPGGTYTKVANRVFKSDYPHVDGQQHNFEEIDFDSYDEWARNAGAYVDAETAVGRNYSNNSVFYFANDDLSRITRLVADDGDGNGTEGGAFTTWEWASPSPYANDALEITYELKNAKLETGSGDNMDGKKIIKDTSDTDNITSIAVDGLGSKDDKNFILDIKAKNLVVDYDLESIDLTISFNSDLFGSIEQNAIKFNKSLFPIANAVHIDNDKGEIRIAAASLQHLDQKNSGDRTGEDLEYDDEEVVASIALNFSSSLEDGSSPYTTTGDGKLVSAPGDATTNEFDGTLGFNIYVNQDSTIFTSDTGSSDSSSSITEIDTLRDLGKDVKITRNDVSLYKGMVELGQTSFLAFGSERKIGVNLDPGETSITTNLIRAGDTVSADVYWKNTGNRAADNIYIDNYNLSDTFADGGEWVGRVIKNKSGLIEVGGDNVLESTSEYASLAGGEFDAYGIYDDSLQEEKLLRVTVEINDNSAGKVFNAGQDLYKVYSGTNGGSQEFDSGIGNSSKNLITFQGDLDYDGNVGMKDLAYLNAGARRQYIDPATKKATTGDSGTYSRDVDANFDGKISIEDLIELDRDWGKTLHTGKDTFTGIGNSQKEITWTELVSQGSYTWDVASFTKQNALEANASVDGYDSPLGTRASTVPGTNSDPDAIYYNNGQLTGGSGTPMETTTNDIRGVELQNDIIGGSSSG